MEGRLELASHQVALSEDIVVLEELDNSNAVLLYHVFNLSHQGPVLFFTGKIEIPSNIRRLGTSSGSVELQVVVLAVTEELSVFDFHVLGSVDEGKEINLLLTDWESEVGQDLSEDLLGNLEVLVTIVVLEEGL